MLEIKYQQGFTNARKYIFEKKKLLWHPLLHLILGSVGFSSCGPKGLGAHYQLTIIWATGLQSQRMIAAWTLQCSMMGIT